MTQLYTYPMTYVGYTSVIWHSAPVLSLSTVSPKCNHLFTCARKKAYEIEKKGGGEGETSALPGAYCQRQHG